MKRFEGDLRADRKRFAIVASRFNDFIVEHLIQGAAGMLRKLGVKDDDVAVFHVPGAFEIPPVAARVASSGRFDAVICLGAVRRHRDRAAGGGGGQGGTFPGEVVLVEGLQGDLASQRPLSHDGREGSFFPGSVFSVA